MKENIQPPIGFETSRRRKLGEEAEQAKREEEYRQTELEEGYRQYTADAIDVYLRDHAEARDELKRLTETYTPRK